jgi:hypothetical protein
MREHDCLGRPVRRAGEQLERAAAVGLGAVATAARVGHGVAAAVLGRYLKDIRRSETIRGRAGKPSTAPSESCRRARPGIAMAAITKRASAASSARASIGPVFYTFGKSPLLPTARDVTYRQRKSLCLRTECTSVWVLVAVFFVYAFNGLRHSGPLGFLHSRTHFVLPFLSSVAVCIRHVAGTQSQSTQRSKSRSRPAVEGRKSKKHLWPSLDHSLRTVHALQHVKTIANRPARLPQATRNSPKKNKLPNKWSPQSKVGIDPPSISRAHILLYADPADPFSFRASLSESASICFPL